MKNDTLIIATPAVNGAPRLDLEAQVETTSDLPSDALGEAVAWALQNSLRAGLVDVTRPGFQVLLSFGKIGT